MKTAALVARAVLLVAAVALPAPAAWSAEAEVVIRATTLEPHVLRAVAGQRVNFVKRVDRPVHVEFGDDPGRHQVFHVPAAGPIWAVFHRPGTHPYVVHVYDGKTTALHGVVEVAESPEGAGGFRRCSVIVMDQCIEP